MKEKLNLNGKIEKTLTIAIHDIAETLKNYFVKDAKKHVEKA